MSLLLALVFVGGLAACASTTTGSDASRESSIETPAPVEPDAEQTAEAFEESEQAVSIPAEAQAEPATAGEEMDTFVSGVTTGAAPPADVAEGIEEFPIQRYEIEEPLEVEAVDDTDAQIDRLRRELAATESELERIRAEEEQRDYSSGQDIASVDSSADGVAGPAPERTTTVQSPEEPKSRARAADLSGKPSESTIYFNYDQATVESQFESVLVAHAEFLKEYPELTVEIQGNCDERGSREYNIALGQQRALAVKRALELLGVEGHRIDAVSFGAEKPVAFGHDEDSWRLNRRADIVY